MTLNKLFFSFCLLLIFQIEGATKPNSLKTHINIFTDTSSSIDCIYQKIENASVSSLSFEKIIRNDSIRHINIFKASALSKKGETYWLKITVLNQSIHPLVLHTTSFYDATLYYKNEKGEWSVKTQNMYTPFFKKELPEFNILFSLPYSKDTCIYYVKMNSLLSSGLGFRLRSTQNVYVGAIKKLATYSLVTGILLLVLIYNMTLFFSSLERIYLYYSGYLLGIIVYANLAWGSFQFLISFLDYNFLYLTVCIIFSTFCLMLYTRKFFNTKVIYPKLDRLILIVMIARLLVFIVGAVFEIDILHDTLVDLLALVPCLCLGQYKFHKGDKSAIYFLVSFWIVIAGLLFNSSIYKPHFFNFFLTPNLLNFNFLDALLFSYSISVKIKILQSEREEEHLKTIEFQKIALQKSVENELLKERYNQELEQAVASQTEELSKANQQLENQAAELARVYELLQVDHKKLENDIEVLRKARLMETNMSFIDFSDTIKNEEVVYNFMAGLKWKGQYKCRKCGYRGYYMINKFTHTCKCKSCGNKESALSNTLLENVHFPLQKALYIAYLIYHNPQIQLRKVADELQLREATCYSFAKKVSEALETKKSDKIKIENWTGLLT